MVYACFLACYDYAVLALISFLPYAPITVEPICFERTFKIINIYHIETLIDNLRMGEHGSAGGVEAQGNV